MPMTKQEAQEGAKIILEQLGGNRFVAMTGANSFSSFSDKIGLTFRIPMVKKIRAVRITLTPADLYDIEFIGGKNFEPVTVEKVEGAYAEDLQRLFTEATGLATKL